jgi:hypothetical protein
MKDGQALSKARARNAPIQREQLLRPSVHFTPEVSLLVKIRHATLQISSIVSQ